MICAACRARYRPFWATPAVVTLILSRELPRQTFLLGGNLIGFEKTSQSRTAASARRGQRYLVPLCRDLCSAAGRGRYRVQHHRARVINSGIRGCGLAPGLRGFGRLWGLAVHGVPARLVAPACGSGNDWEFCRTVFLCQAGCQAHCWGAGLCACSQAVLGLLHLSCPHCPQSCLRVTAQARHCQIPR